MADFTSFLFFILYAIKIQMVLWVHMHRHHNPSSCDITGELCQLSAAKSPNPELLYYVSFTVHLFSLFSTFIFPWGCSCANCFLHSHIQPKVLTSSVIKPCVPLTSMEHSPSHTEEGSSWPSPEKLSGMLCLLVHQMSLLAVMHPLRCWCLIKEAGSKCRQKKEGRYRSFYSSQTMAPKADRVYVMSMLETVLRERSYLFNHKLLGLKWGPGW